MKLCVIGAGAAGLCAAKNGIDFGCDVTVFEQTNSVGGTWVYTDDIGMDKNGLDVHSSMYQGLYTNLPKEIMSYPDLPYPEQENSYISAEEVLSYYQNYAEKFNLQELIKFENYVVRVRPLLNDEWEVIVRDLTVDKLVTYSFDAVLICNGHYNAPNMPNYKGKDVFQGKQMHSHDYRSSDIFKGEKVLIVGAGPSGTDCTIEASIVAEHVTWSNHLKKPSVNQFEGEVVQKPDIKEIKINGVEFEDGSYQEFTLIVYCTGYKYTFPFLSVDSGITCGESYIRPLYKQILNINFPSLGIIGLPNYICPNQLFDLQSRFSLTFMTGRKKLPSKEEMLEDTENYMKARREQGIPDSKAHYMGIGVHDKYYEDLAATAEVLPIKPVMAKIFAKGLCNLLHNSGNFRNDVFKIMDDDNFTINGMINGVYGKEN